VVGGPAVECHAPLKQPSRLALNAQEPVDREMNDQVIRVPAPEWNQHPEIALDERVEDGGLCEVSLHVALHNAATVPRAADRTCVRSHGVRGKG
jgi:hypothetical protein